MGLFSLALNSARDLLMVQLEALYDGEKRLADALPAMFRAARAPELQLALSIHQEQTQRHIARLEEVFGRLGSWAQRETCAAMKGLIADAINFGSATGDAAVKDSALVASIQAIEHYQIAGYGTAGCLARQLGHEPVAAILQSILDEIVATDQALTGIAAEVVQPQALTS